jgi:hypothetical protein
VSKAVNPIHEEGNPLGVHANKCARIKYIGLCLKTTLLVSLSSLLSLLFLSLLLLL